MKKDRNTLINFCKRNNIDIEILISNDTSTSKKVLEKTNIPLDKIGKTVIFVDENKNPFAVLIRAIYKISQNELAKILGKKHIRLAKAEEVINYTGYVPGGISPLDLPIKLILDKELLNYDYIWVGGGDTQTLIKVKISDIIKLQNPQIIEVPKKRIQ